MSYYISWRVRNKCYAIQVALRAWCFKRCISVALCPEGMSGCWSDFKFCRCLWLPRRSLFKGVFGVSARLMTRISWLSTHSRRGWGRRIWGVIRKWHTWPLLRQIFLCRAALPANCESCIGKVDWVEVQVGPCLFMCSRVAEILLSGWMNHAGFSMEGRKAFEGKGREKASHAHAFQEHRLSLWKRHVKMPLSACKNVQANKPMPPYLNSANRYKQQVPASHDFFFFSPQSWSDAILFCSVLVSVHKKVLKSKTQCWGGVLFFAGLVPPTLVS